ncbi:hypothetical protein ACLKA7_013721 [Drosophila subpalustris]
MSCYYRQHEDASVTIPKYSVESSAGITYYDIKVRVGNVEWFVERRYRDFAQLHEKLVEEISISKKLLPPKKLVGNKQPAFLEQRREQLETYLQELLIYFSNELPRLLAVFLEFNKYDIIYLLQDLAKLFNESGDALLSAKKEYNLSALEVRGIKYSLGVMHMPKTNFSPELQHTLQSEQNFASIQKLSKYVKRHSRWHSRHDQSKRIYFNYLLLDPRITNGLKQRARSMHRLDVWLTFLRAIFYVGKGKSSRPYAHFRQAQKQLQSANPHVLAKDPKLALIVHLWQQQRGVLLLRAFNGVTSNDAHSREAAMIDALGMNHLTNRRVGVYFGLARKKFTSEQRKQLGVALLHMLLSVYMIKTERELQPAPVPKTAES